MTKPKHWTARLGAKTPAERRTLEKLAGPPSDFNPDPADVEAVAMVMFFVSCQMIEDTETPGMTWAKAKDDTKRDWRVLAHVAIHAWRSKAIDRLRRTLDREAASVAPADVKAQRTRTRKRGK